MDPALQRIRKVLKNPFFFGFAIGIVYFGYIFWWLWSLHPLNTVGIQNNLLSIFVVTVAYAGSVLVSAAAWGTLFWTISWLAQYHSHFFAPTVASLVVLTEYVRAWLFGILWLGSGSLLGPHWSFGNLSYIFTDTPLLAKTAAVWGMYGIIFMVVWVLGLVWSTRKKDRHPSLIAQGILLVCLVGLASTFDFKDTEGSQVAVSIIQTNKNTKPTYSPAEQLSDFQQKLQMLIGVGKNASSPTIVAFPEGASFNTALSEFLPTSEVQSFFQKMSDQELLIIDNMRVSEGTNLLSKTIVMSSHEGFIGSSDKQVLTPGGEFVPFVVRWAVDLLKLSPLEILPGVATPIQYSGMKIGVALCSEILSPDTVRKNPGDLIIGGGSLALFRGDPHIDRQMRTAARMRALEQQKYVIWASNTGSSYIVDPSGNIASIAPRSTYQILTGAVVPNTGRTWYTTVGDWPIFSLSLVISLWSFRKKIA